MIQGTLALCRAVAEWYNFDRILSRNEVAAIEIIPSIDLREGKVVRLYQGDYIQETVFSDDPLDVALQYQSVGAPRLHIVDLDGAASGELGNREVIEDIARALLIPVQLGGGIRDLAMIESLLKAGIERVILGTAAVEDPDLVKDACKRFRDSVVVGIDAREGRVATRGWLRDTGQTAVALGTAMADAGVRRFVYTDITRDGTLTEPNFAAVSEMIEALRLPVIAAGGVATVNHLNMLQKLGCEGAIIGKALYTGDINLKQALAELSRL
jgi:phosphoribosylformimino-5-aminoimidazole carboxamide ribotide isomerase